MLDESMFEDIHEIAENSAYLKAVEEKQVNTSMWDSLPPYEELKELEEKLKGEGKVNFHTIFSEPTGYYFIKCFLIADYAVDKAIFLKDVEAYRSMRFESARKRVAKFIYTRFVSPGSDNQTEFKKGSSVFQIIQQRKDLVKEEDEKDMKEVKSIVSTSAAPSQSSVASGVPPVVSPPNPRQSSQSAAQPSTATTVTVTPAGTTSVAVQSRTSSFFQMGDQNNAIGVYGASIKRVRERVHRGEAPKDLFDEVAADVLNDLKLDAFPRFLQSDFYKKYFRSKCAETLKVTVKDFVTFRVLGRGGFGAVHACRKNNSGQIYAMKCVNKKLVKVKNALDNVLEERNVLAMMKSSFVTNLKYALQDEDTLYLIMDLMLGGDLKFHLINAGRFTEKRAKFYAAQVLLGLEHVHSHSVIYRDMKLENVLLDHNGNCKISDLGLAVVTKGRVKGYAGTPGYTAPEMIKNKHYGPSVDIFSFGVMLYRMLSGSKPFKGKVDRDLDRAVLDKQPAFPPEIFSKEAIDLLQGLLQKKPEKRLGCSDRGIEEIKEHPFFEEIDWGLLEAGYIDPPFIPNRFDVNAASLKDIGDFDRARYRTVKLDDKFKAKIKNFEYVSMKGLQDEMVMVLEKVDENVNYEKFAAKPKPAVTEKVVATGSCCVIL